MVCDMQIVSVSSAATAFRTVSDVSSVILAAWRLQLTGLLLLPGAIIQYWQLSAGRALPSADACDPAVAIKLPHLASPCPVA